MYNLLHILSLLLEMILALGPLPLYTNDLFIFYTNDLITVTR